MFSSYLQTGEKFAQIIRTLFLIGKKMVELKEKMKGNPKLKKKNKKASGASGATSAEMNGDVVTAGERVTSAAGREPSEDEEEEVSSTSSPVPQTGNGRETKFPG